MATDIRPTLFYCDPGGRGWLAGMTQEKKRKKLETKNLYLKTARYYLRLYI